MLQWQGMIWDHASNWDEEELRALVIYLHTLPAVQQEIPPNRPPAADDCIVYTFWITQSVGPGCRLRWLSTLQVQTECAPSKLRILVARSRHKNASLSEIREGRERLKF